MKQVLAIEGNSEAAASLLLHLAILLAQHKLHPQSLVWSLGVKGEIRLWMVLDGEQVTLNPFAEECRNLSGVDYLAQEPAGDRCRVFDWIRDFESHSPFEIIAPAAGAPPGSIVLPDSAAGAATADRESEKPPFMD